MTGQSETEDDRLLEVLRERQLYRSRYWTRNDPLLSERLLWRAQTFRHLVHLLPGQTVLELGHDPAFRTRLAEVARGRNPIVSVSFDGTFPAANSDGSVLGGAEFLRQASLGPIADCAVGIDLLDERNAQHLLAAVLRALRPGGQLILFESNPWNPWLRLRRAAGIAAGDSRRLFSRSDLYRICAEAGFTDVFAVFNDFVYGPAARVARSALESLSVVAENVPLLNRFAGGIIIHARKAGHADRPRVSLAEHPGLINAVSVVVPCHNEESNIAALVDALRTYYGPYIHEIILVDDNSADGTWREIGGLAAADSRIVPVRRSPPNGVGRALKEGYARSTGRFVLSLDADFQHLLPELQDLFAAAEGGADVVIGSRFSRHSVLLNYPWPKIVANRGFHMLAGILFRRRFRDLTNNLKIFRREALDGMDLHSPGFSVNAETGLIPLLQGRAIREVPISWINRTPGMGVSSFRLPKVMPGYGAVLWRLWWKGSGR